MHVVALIQNNFDQALKRKCPCVFNDHRERTAETQRLLSVVDKQEGEAADV